MATLVVGAVVALGGSAMAHPLGDFTANTAARLVVGVESVRVDYVLDLAEVPTVQVRRSIDTDGDGAVGQAEAASYRGAECARIAAGQQLTVDSAAATLQVDAATLTFPDGRAGLMTLRLECVLHAATPPLPDEATVAYEDTTRHDRIGWREVTAVGDRTTLLSSDVPAESPSGRLTAYPEDLLAAPLRVTSATLAVDPSVGPAGPPPPVEGGVPAPTGLGAITDAFTDLVARQQLTVPFALLAVAFSLGVGGLHAAAPGHGKTVMAAYLVADRGRTRDALVLGGVVSATHTIGVLLLGLAISLSGTLAPEHLYRPLGLLSGALFVVLGITLLRRARRHPAHTHTHGPGGHHHHEDHAEHHAAAGGHGAVATLVRPVAPPAHDHHHHDHHDAPRLGWRGMVLPGLAGGMVPTPSALLVLLGGIALGRAWFGVVLVLAYGIGMAAALVAAGWLLQRARGRLDHRAAAGGGWLARAATALPVVSAAAVILAGLVVIGRAALA